MSPEEELSWPERPRWKSAILEVVLKSPQDKKYPSLEAWMVYAREVDYSPSVNSPLEWMLLTTIEVDSLEQACERLAM